jgi:hypothetical protein
MVVSDAGSVAGLGLEPRAGLDVADEEADEDDPAPPPVVCVGVANPLLLPLSAPSSSSDTGSTSSSVPLFEVDALRVVTTVGVGGLDESAAVPVGGVVVAEEEALLEVTGDDTGEVVMGEIGRVEAAAAPVGLLLLVLPLELDNVVALVPVAAEVGVEDVVGLVTWGGDFGSVLVTDVGGIAVARTGALVTALRVVMAGGDVAPFSSFVSSLSSLTSSSSSLSGAGAFGFGLSPYSASVRVRLRALNISSI